MRNWRVKLNLRTDQLTRLWTRELGSRNVEVWSEELGEWVPLVVIPELRESIASASERPPAPDEYPCPPPQVPPPPRVPSFAALAGSGHGGSEARHRGSRAELPFPAPTVDHDAEARRKQARTELPPPPPSSQRLPTQPTPLHEEPASLERLASTSEERAPDLATSHTAGESIAPLTAPSLPPSAFPPPLPKWSSSTEPGLERTAYVLFGVALCLWALVAINRPFQSREVTQIVAPPASLPATDQVRTASAQGATSPGVLRIDDLPRTAQPPSRADAPTGARRSSTAPERRAETPGSTVSGLNLTMARAALASAGRRAQSCGKSAISGRVQVTFAPTGFASQVSLLGVQGVEVNRGCVERAFREMRVNPFSGAPVSVKKSF